jgi:hypothetical protein
MDVFYAITIPIGHNIHVHIPRNCFEFYCILAIAQAPEAHAGQVKAHKPSQYIHLYFWQRFWSIAIHSKQQVESDPSKRNIQLCSVVSLTHANQAKNILWDQPDPCLLGQEYPERISQTHTYRSKNI